MFSTPALFASILAQLFILFCTSHLGFITALSWLKECKVNAVDAAWQSWRCCCHWWISWSSARQTVSHLCCSVVNMPCLFTCRFVLLSVTVTACVFSCIAHNTVMRNRPCSKYGILEILGDGNTHNLSLIGQTVFINKIMCTLYCNNCICYYSTMCTIILFINTVDLTKHKFVRPSLGWHRICNMLGKSSITVSD